MKKEFVTYEIALALKELGFDEPCIKGLYNKEPIYTVVTTPVDFNNKKQLGELLSAPTFSQAFRWFREKYNVNTVISWRDDLLNYDISLTEMKKYGYFYYKENYKTYEEAELECLKKLIEIVKEKQL